jgi:hypothetical protein
MLMPCPLPVYAPGTTLADLRTAELLLTLTLRLADPSAHHHGWSNSNWREGLVAAGLGPNGIRGAEHLFRFLSIAATRPLMFEDLSCPTLGDNEGRFIQLVSLVQNGRLKAAHALLETWLPRAAVRLALPCVTALADAMAQRSLFLPLRHASAGQPSYDPAAYANSGMVFLQ